jgi:hypothetical protein
LEALGDVFPDDAVGDVDFVVVEEDLNDRVKP